jgi:hypothetical protein
MSVLDWVNWLYVDTNYMVAACATLQYSRTISLSLDDFEVRWQMLIHPSLMPKAKLLRGLGRKAHRTAQKG